MYIDRATICCKQHLPILSACFKPSLTTIIKIVNKSENFPSYHPLCLCLRKQLMLSRYWRESCSSPKRFMVIICNGFHHPTIHATTWASISAGAVLVVVCLELPDRALLLLLLISYARSNAAVFFGLPVDTCLLVCVARAA